MLPALLFFLWNPFDAWMINIIYAICANIPCIISQRYNGPRVMQLMNKKVEVIVNQLPGNFLKISESKLLMFFDEPFIL